MHSSRKILEIAFLVGLAVLKRFSSVNADFNFAIEAVSKRGITVEILN